MRSARKLFAWRFFLSGPAQTPEGASLGNLDPQFLHEFDGFDFQVGGPFTLLKIAQGVLLGFLGVA